MYFHEAKEVVSYLSRRSQWEIVGDRQCCYRAEISTRELYRPPNSFSSVSALLIARVGAFLGFFRDLQDCHSFAPLQF